MIQEMGKVDGRVRIGQDCPQVKAGQWVHRDSSSYFLKFCVV